MGCLFVLSVMCGVRGVPLWVECVFVSVVHPVDILSAVFCVICSLLKFVLLVLLVSVVLECQMGIC